MEYGDEPSVGSRNVHEAYIISDVDSEGSSTGDEDENFNFSISEEMFSQFCEASSGHRSMCNEVLDLEYCANISLEGSIDMLSECEILKNEIGYEQPEDYIHQEFEDSIFAESGDDYIYAGKNPLIGIAETVIAKKFFGIKVSPEDTFVSSELAFFTGKVVLMPKDSTETIDKMTREKTRSKTMPIIDIGPQRVMLPIASQRVDVSSSIEGKMGLLSRVAAYSRGSLDELYQAKASIIQDVLLGVGTYGKKFPYLPSSLGGYDKSFPFECEENIDRSMYWFKRGTYRGLISTIISHAYYVIRPADHGKPRRSAFLDKVKRLYSGWQPWYTTYGRQLPTFSGKLPGSSAQFCVGKYGESFSKDLALRRLCKEGLIVSENTLVIANEVQAYTQALLDPVGIKVFQEERANLEKQFRQDTAFSRSFASLFTDYISVDIVRSLTKEEKAFAVSINLDSTIKVSNFLHGEQFFTSDALNEIYLVGPQKVKLDLVVGSFSTAYLPPREPPDKQFLGIEDEELNALYTWLLDGKGELPPRDLLEDDDIIYESILSSLPTSFNVGEVPSVIIVSDDMVLCRKINREIGVVVWRLPSLFFLEYDQREDKEKPLILRDHTQNFEFFRNKIFQIEPRATFYGVELDTGSITAAAFKLHRANARVIEHDRRNQNFTVRDPATESVLIAKSLFENWPKDRSTYIFDNYDAVNAIARKGNAANWRVKLTAEEIAEEIKTRRAYKAHTVLASVPKKNDPSLTKAKAFGMLSRLKQRVGLEPKVQNQGLIQVQEDIFEFRNALAQSDSSDDDTEQEDTIANTTAPTRSKVSLKQFLESSNSIAKLFKGSSRS